MTPEEEARRQAVRLLSRRPHSRRQLALTLSRRFPPGAVEAVLDRLTEAGLLDDRQLAVERARYGRHRKHWGDARIRADLRRLGIDAKIVNSAMLQIDGESSEQEPLERVIEAWVTRQGKPQTAAQMKKLFDHCLRRGFASWRVREALQPLWAAVEWEAGSRQRL